MTNTGKVRKNNEDCILVNGMLVGGDMDEVGCERSEGDRLAYMVADGMGGHAKGELASRTALTAFKDGREIPDTAAGIRDLMRMAKEELDRQVEKDRSAFGMGTTVAGIFFRSGKGFLLNCGDSRVYECDDSLRKMTRDHSLVQELAEAGVISEGEMRLHPQKNIVTSALMGGSSSGLPVYSMSETGVTEGQKFLLCTDGLWESLSDHDMAECLRNRPIREGADRLFGKAIEAGAADNVSFILLEVEKA